MKIAIATFGTRVSPRFDCAQSFLIVTVEDDKVAYRTEIAAADWAPHHRVGKLVELGVEVVIWGAIDRWSAESFEAENITVYGWVTGEVDDALNCLIRGELVSEAIMGTGGRCCGRWRFRSPTDNAEPVDQTPPFGQGKGQGRGAGGRGRGRGLGRGRGR